MIVGLGHPRCGTGFTSALLRESGLDVGHEELGADGIVSWLAAAESHRVPFGVPLGRMDDAYKVFCVARSPLSAIPSIMGEDIVRKSYRFRRRQLHRITGRDVLPMEGGDPVLAAVSSYVHWFELCLTHNPDIIFRVDHNGDDAILSAFVGRKVIRSENIERNARPGRKRRIAFTLSDLSRLPSGLLIRLAVVATKLGYAEDALQIAQLCDDSISNVSLGAT